MARADAAAAIGNGRYRLVYVAGMGGSATVYRAWDTRHRAWFAAKVLLPAVAARADLRARFEQEARALARLRHPNVLPMLEYGVDDDRVWLITDWAANGSLADAADARGALEPAFAVALVREVLSALAHAHERQIVHRDVKPSNVMLDNDGRATLVDFGIARLVDEPLRLTRDGLSMGTLAYMAPEQRRDASQVDARADIYAVGALLYFLLTVRSPAELSAPHAQRGAVLMGLPPALAAIVERATRHEPGERYPSAAAFDEALAGLGLPAVPGSDRIRALYGGAPQVIPPDPDPRVAEKAPFVVPTGLGVWAAILLGVGGVAVAAASLSPGAPPPTFVSRLLAAPGSELRGAFPKPGTDGVFYASRGQLYLLADGLLPQILPGPPCVDGGFVVEPGGRTALASCDLALVRIDLGSGAQTSLGVSGVGPTLSADGSRLAWVDAGGAVWVADPARIEAAVVVRRFDPFLGAVVALSPNGRRLAINAQIVAADGQAVGRVEIVDLVRGTATEVRASPELASPRVPALGVTWWDDEHVVYATAEENADGRVWMQTIGRAGPRGEPEALARIPYATINLLVADPQSRRVLATVVTEQLDVTVSALGPDGLGARTVLTSPGWTDRLVGWTADGEVVYQSARGTDFDLFAQRPGAEPRVIAARRGVHETWGQRLPDAWLFWSVEGTKAELTRLPDHGEPRALLALSTVGGGGVLKRPPPLDAAFACAPGGAPCFVLLPDAEGTRLVGFDGVTGRMSSAIATLVQPAPALAVSPDGARVAVLFVGRVEIRDAVTGVVRLTVPVLPGINGLSFAMDGRLIVAHGPPWRVDAVDPVGVVTALVPSVHTWVALAAVSPDGLALAWTLGSEHEDLWALEVP